MNADNIISGVGGNILGNNVFAYCFNNPVNMDDGTGNWPQWLKNSVKWVAKNIVKPVVKSIRSTLADVDLTYTAGISGSITPGKTLENAQIGIAMDTKGNVEIQYSLNGGVTTGSMSGSVAGYNTITNATDIDKLTGPGYQIGGSYTGAPVIVGGDLNIIPDSDENTTYYGGTLSGGFAFGSGGEVHVTIGKTFSIPKTKFNVFDAAKAAYIKIMEW